MAEWFAPKRYGWGSRPVTWQGWAITLAYVAIIAGASRLVERSFWAAGSIILTATAIFILILSKTTRGGWRWRWGGDE